jgi:sporulation protein YlmC with PRC-barrel domain
MLAHIARRTKGGRTERGAGNWPVLHDVATAEPTIRHHHGQEHPMRRLPIAAYAAMVSCALMSHAGAQPAPPPANPPAAAAPAEVAPDNKSVTNPNLTVASVKMENGYRASKVIGAAVYNDQNQQIGTVDDLILNMQNQIVLSVISVGGFLGVGGKLVALPYESLHRENGKITMPNADKNTLATMPNFTYGP